MRKGKFGEVRGQRADKHPKKSGLVPQFMWGTGKALGGPWKLGGRGGLLCEYPVSLSWGGGSEETLVPLLGEQAIETTNPKEVECPWKSHTGEGKELVFVTG